MSRTDTAAHRPRPAGGVPRVAAVLVVHDGEEWLGSVLSTLASQRYPALDLVVVDNASRDGSPAILDRRIPADRLLRLQRNVGFSRAVARALQHEAVAGADLVLLLHDDLVLAPNAIARLVRTLREDPSVGIVGPKLRDWSEEPILQEVGMTIDRFGRAESPLEAAELDQGQHDLQRPVLYVSSAGMLARREVLEELSGFDTRYPAFREDLDLCWRAWLSGQRVAVVPDAVAYHIAAASRAARAPGRRPGQGRYYAERHSLATLLKNYGAVRLLWVLPIVLALAAGKTLAFLATRRFADAAAVVRAYLWNAAQLPATLRRRRVVQHRRRVRDTALDPLFATGLPRARVYLEAVGSWLAGGSTRALLEDADGTVLQEEARGSAIVRTVRRYPAASAGLVLLALYLVGLRNLLPGGQIVGGDIAPWPEAARAFLRAYVSPWNGEPVGSDAFSSPLQAVLGLVSMLGLGSAWLAQRLVVFGLLPLAWLLTLRAGRLVTARPGPRVLGATVYVLSPAVLGTLAQGRFGTLVAAALLPGLTILAMRAADRRTPVKTAWRSAALLALGLAVTAAAEPGLAPVLGLVYAAFTVAVLRDGARQPGVRLVMAGGAALGLLLPWLVDLVRSGSAPTALGVARAELPLWRAVTAAPELGPTLAGLAGARAALTTVAIVAIGLLVGMRTRPGSVAALVSTGAAAGLLAWAAARLDVGWLWAPSLLVPGALAFAGLAVITARTLGGGLGSYAFGTRQLGVAVAGVALAVGLAGAAFGLAAGPWQQLARDPLLVPQFVTADAPRVGPYRVLLLTVADDAIAWDLMPADGPSMVDFGTRAGGSLLDLVDRAVAGAVGGADLRAGARLGVANVRYVVVSGAPGSAAVVDALGRQPALEPLPSGGGRVFQVTSWLPRAVVVPPERGAALLANGDPGATRPLEEQGLTRLRRHVYTSGDPVPGGGVLVASEDESPRWRATAGGEPLERVELEGVNAFTVPPDPGVVRVRAAGTFGHRLLVALQVLLALAVISLALRPPRFTQGRASRAVARGLPAGVAVPERHANDGPRELLR